MLKFSTGVYKPPSDKLPYLAVIVYYTKENQEVIMSIPCKDIEHGELIIVDLLQQIYKENRAQLLPKN